jgi:hypothetical protein
MVATTSISMSTSLSSRRHAPQFGRCSSCHRRDVDVFPRERVRAMPDGEKLTESIVAIPTQ